MCTLRAQDKVATIDFGKLEARMLAHLAAQPGYTWQAATEPRTRAQKAQDFAAAYGGLHPLGSREDGEGRTRR